MDSQLRALYDWYARSRPLEIAMIWVCKTNTVQIKDIPLRINSDQIIGHVANTSTITDQSVNGRPMYNKCR